MGTKAGKVGRLAFFLGGWLFSVCLAPGQNETPAPEGHRVVSLSLEALDTSNRVIFEDVDGGPEREVLVLSDGGLDVFQFNEARTGLTRMGRFPLGRYQGILGFARLDPESKRTPIVMDDSGIRSLHLTQPHERSVLKQTLAIPSSPKLTLALVGVDFHGTGREHLLVPGTVSYQLLRSNNRGRFDSLELPGAWRQNRLQLSSDDGPHNPIIPAMRRLEVGQHSQAEHVSVFTGDDTLPAVFVVVSTVGGGESIRYDQFPLRLGGNFPTRPSSSLTLPHDPRAEDLPVRMADGRIRVVRAVSNLDLLAPRTNFTLHETQARPLGRWTSRDPIGLAAVTPLADSEGPSLITASLRIQAGSTPDMAGLVTGKPLTYILSAYRPSADGKTWVNQPEELIRMDLSVDPAVPRTEVPFFFRDVNGDGLSDLIIRSDPGRIHVHLASDSGKFRQVPSYSVDVPADATLDFVDMNGDGSDDIVLVSRGKREVLIVQTSAKNQGGRSLLRRLNPLPIRR
jgi:hypothetical protein